ncbi:MAG: beta-propeller fold lactonase family protein, partial [Verrucomicrobiota bacterium]
TWIENVPARVQVPRGFAIDPGGRWLVVAGQKDNRVTVFKINSETGRLSPTDQVVSIGSPVCVLFAPVNTVLPLSKH